MTRNRRLLVFTIMPFILFCVALGAHAAEEGATPAAAQATELFKWINFAIVAGAILWLGLKKGPAFFRGRADTISTAINKATAAKSVADRQLAEAEAKIARLGQEIAEFSAAAERAAAAETERLRTLTHSDAQKIAVAAGVEIVAAERSARLELKAIAAKLAVDGAESLLAKQLTPAAQESLISNFVRSLEGRPN